MSKRTRSQQIHFMVSEHERELIEQKMQEAGIRNMGAYLRKMSIDGYIIHMDLSDVRELISLLRNATNNLNQIARRANETRSIYETDVQDLQEHYDKLWEKADGILRALAKIN